MDAERQDASDALDRELANLLAEIEGEKIPTRLLALALQLQARLSALRMQDAPPQSEDRLVSRNGHG